jgi:hypothetical protein
VDNVLGTNRDMAQQTAQYLAKLHECQTDNVMWLTTIGHTVELYSALMG